MITRRSLWTGAVFLFGAAGCSGEPVLETDETSWESTARDNSLTAPMVGEPDEWDENDTTPPSVVGMTVEEFISSSYAEMPSLLSDSDSETTTLYGVDSSPSSISSGTSPQQATQPTMPSLFPLTYPSFASADPPSLDLKVSATSADGARRPPNSGTASNPTENLSNVCEICFESFAKRFSLTRHMKRHTGAKPYPCHYASCLKSFAERSTLKRHLRVHTGEKPYQCSVQGCGKYFADRTNVKRHEMIHSGDRPHWCNQNGCKRGYFWRKHLKKHLLSVHNVVLDDNALRSVKRESTGNAKEEDEENDDEGVE